jgi:MFS family permease
VTFARILPAALFGLVAGVAADRWNRKRLMIAADGVRVLAIGSLALTILLDELRFWQIQAVAFVEGTGSTFFRVASAGALRAVVRRRQLPSAAGAQEARLATVMLAGPPRGGALFGLGRAVPFVFDAASYVLSTLSLLLMRTPFQEVRATDATRLRSQVADGFRFLWNQPFLRTCAFLYGLTNFIGPAVLLVLVVVGTAELRLGAGDRRRLRLVRPRARAVGNAEPVDPKRTEPRCSRYGTGQGDSPPRGTVPLKARRVGADAAEISTGW